MTRSTLHSLLLDPAITCGGSVADAPRPWEPLVVRAAGDEEEDSNGQESSSEDGDEDDGGFDDDDLGFDGGFAPAELEEFDEADFDDDFDDDFEEEPDDDEELDDDLDQADSDNDPDEDEFEEELEFVPEPPRKVTPDKSAGKPAPGKPTGTGKAAPGKPGNAKPARRRELDDDEAGDEGFDDE